MIIYVIWFVIFAILFMKGDVNMIDGRIVVGNYDYFYGSFVFNILMIAIHEVISGLKKERNKR